MRTEEQKLMTRLRKAEERQAHHDRVFSKHPDRVRYAKAQFKKGSKRQKQSNKPVKLGIQ